MDINCLCYKFTCTKYHMQSNFFLGRPVLFEGIVPKNCFFKRFKIFQITNIFLTTLKTWSSPYFLLLNIKIISLSDEFLKIKKIVSCLLLSKFWLITLGTFQIFSIFSPYTFTYWATLPEGFKSTDDCFILLMKRFQDSEETYHSVMQTVNKLNNIYF